VLPFEGTSSFCQAVFELVFKRRGAELRLKNEQAAQRCMNEEQTAPLQTALLH
jgi:hypothetical protein